MSRIKERVEEKGHSAAAATPDLWWKQMSDAEGERIQHRGWDRAASCAGAAWWLLALSSCRGEATTVQKLRCRVTHNRPQPIWHGYRTDPSLHGGGCAVESARRPGLAKPGARARTESRLRGTGSSTIVSRGPAAGQLRTFGLPLLCACTQTGIVRPGGGGGGHAAACGAGPSSVGRATGASQQSSVLPLSARLALPPGAAHRCSILQCACV